MGGRKTKAQPTMELLFHLKLLGIDGQYQVYVMPRGKRLSGLVNDCNYELSDHQKQLLSSWYVSDNGEICKQWLSYFTTTNSGEQQAVRSQIAKPLQQWTEEMIYLGVAFQYGDRIELSGENAWIRAYPVEQQPMTLEELQAILQQQVEAGQRAEEFALIFEKKRLRQLGLVSESDRVKCISDKLVNAGYDIVSFSISAQEPNRFIEVKSVGPNLAFYWSRHELEVAKVLGNQYFLYLVDLTDPIEPFVNIIENPYAYLSLHAHLEPIQYRVSFGKNHNEVR
ncbi:DUF3883 domain-containing protein [Bacillus thuringiensis]|nr:DUF3883 domain-containing protein [Bacillus thuringiensis]